jgi:DNA-binding MurR/RpiR family transcriptional regulator
VTRAYHQTVRAEQTTADGERMVDAVDLLSRLRDKMFVGPAGAYARDVLDALKRLGADALVVSEMQLGAMAAAESAQLPCVVLSPTSTCCRAPGCRRSARAFNQSAGPSVRCATGSSGRR